MNKSASKPFRITAHEFWEAVQNAYLDREGHPIKRDGSNLYKAKKISASLGKTKYLATVEFSELEPELYALYKGKDNLLGYSDRSILRLWKKDDNANIRKDLVNTLCRYAYRMHYLECVYYGILNPSYEELDAYHRLDTLVKEKDYEVRPNLDIRSLNNQEPYLHYLDELSNSLYSVDVTPNIKNIHTEKTEELESEGHKIQNGESESGNVDSKSINVLNRPGKQKVVYSSVPKWLNVKYIVFVLLFLSLCLYMIFMPIREQSISGNLSSFGNVAFSMKPTHRETSPICGCLTDSFRLKGVGFIAKQITLNESIEHPYIDSFINNYVFTAPLFSPSYLGHQNFYCEMMILEKSSFASYDPSEIAAGRIPGTCKLIEKKDIGPLRFISVATDQSLRILLNEKAPISSLRPMTKSKIFINKVRSSMDNKVSKILINEEYSPENDSTHEMPTIDFMGPEIFIIVEDNSVVFADDRSMFTLKQKQYEGHSLMTIIKLKVPFTSRMACSSTSLKHLSWLEWNYIRGQGFAGIRFLDSLSNSKAFDFHLRDIVGLDKGGKIMPTKPDLHLDLPIMYRESGNISLTLSGFLTTEQYNNLHDRFKEQKEILYTYPSWGKLLNISAYTLQGIDLATANQIMASVDTSTSPETQLNNSNRLKEQLLSKYKLNAPKGWIDIDKANQHQIFLLPSLPKENGVFIDGNIDTIEFAQAVCAGVIDHPRPEQTDH